VFKTKIVSLFLLPAVAAYSLAAGFVYGEVGKPLFDVEALKATAILSFACALIQDLLPRPFKEALVFWRLRNRLPGHRAFVKAKSDRYDLERVTNYQVLASLSGDHQQRLFYQIYKKHREEPTVAHCNFRYCAWRDTASLFFCIAAATIPLAYAISEASDRSFEWRPAITLTGGAALAYLLTAVAARQVANTLVGQVLSCETAEPPHAIAH